MRNNDSNSRSLARSNNAASARFNFVRYILGFAATLTFIFLPQSAHGQNSPITATINGTDFSTDELIILTVTVVDDSAQQPRPILPRLDGLAVIDLDISTDVSVVSNKIHTEVTYTYRLQPRRTGLLTIPPVTVKIDGETFKAQPLSINIRQGTAPAPSPGNAVSPDNISPPAGLNGQDFFVESQVDRLTPYVGQQIIHTFRFYQAIQLYRQPQYEGPLFTGFETFGLPVREFNLDIAGRTYLITEIQTALFAKNSGRVTIGAARLMFPSSFFEEPAELYSDPVVVDVQPLPANAPPGFNGAVGQYEIKAWFSPQVAVINQPSTFYVAVSGVGNLHILPEPTWPALATWRAYDTLTSLTSDITDNGLMTGTRVFERLVVPGQVGDLTIPPASLVYFDPTIAQYQTISTNPLLVKVIEPPTPVPTRQAAIVTVPTATPVSASPEASVPVSVDDEASRIFLDSIDPNLRLALPFWGFLFVGMCGLIPAAVVAGAGGLWLWQKRKPAPKKPRQEADTLQRPSHMIHPVVAAAMQKTGDNYTVVSRALNAYFKNSLNISINGLTRTELAHRLREYGLDGLLIERVVNCLAQSEIGRYGPIGSDAGWSLLAETDELLSELDKAFRIA